MWLKFLGASLAFGVLVGVVGTLLFSGNTPGLVATVVVSMVLAPTIVTKLLLPGLYRSQLRKIAARGGESPPPGSEPVASPLVTAWAEAIDSGDLDTAARLLDDGFACECPQLGKTFPRARYLKALGKTRREFPTLRYTVHEVREAGGGLWVRATTHLQARRGDPIVTEAWEAWRVDGERILGIRQGKVLEISGAGAG